MSEFNLKGPHVSCLYYLHATGGATATEICEMSEDDKATVSRSIDYLEEIGLINASTKDTKNYNVFLTLTEKGSALAKKISDKIENVLNLAGDKIKDKKRKNMYECLMTINENLENIVKGYDTPSKENKKQGKKVKKEEKKATKAKKKATKAKKKATKRKVKEITKEKKTKKNKNKEHKEA